MIIGLGSVGTYLLNYLISKNDPAIHIVVAGRNIEKMQKQVNIVRISSLIRRENKSHINVEAEVDLNNIESIVKVIRKWRPDSICPHTFPAYTAIFQTWISSAGINNEIRRPFSDNFYD